MKLELFGSLLTSENLTKGGWRDEYSGIFFFIYRETLCRHETINKPSHDSIFFFFFTWYHFSWCLQELSAGKSQDCVTSQSTALGSHHSAPPTPTKLMGLPAKEERHIAIMACVSHTKTSACSCGGQVRTRLAVCCIVLGTHNMIQYPAVIHSVYGSSTLRIYSQWQSLRNFSCLTHLENETQISHAQTMSDKWQVSGWHRVRWLPGPAGISHMRVSLMQEHSQHQTLALRMSMLLEMSTGTVGRTSTATTGSVRKGRKHGSWELLSGDVFYMLQNYGPVDKNRPYFGFHPSLTPGKPAAS